MKLSLGCDHGGYLLKEQVKAYLLSKGHEVVDCGTNSLESCNYPIFARKIVCIVVSGVETALCSVMNSLRNRFCRRLNLLLTQVMAPLYFKVESALIVLMLSELQDWYMRLSS